MWVMAEGSGMELEEEAVEELCALQAILGDTFERAPGGCVRAWVPSRGHPREVVMQAHLPPDYPSRRAPILELHSSWVSAPQLSALALRLERGFRPGEVVLYGWVEELRTAWHDLAPCADGAAAETGVEPDCDRDAAPGAAADDEDDSHRREACCAASPEGEGASALPRHDPVRAALSSRIVHGGVLTEKRSSFQGHAARIVSVEEVRCACRVRREAAGRGGGWSMDGTFSVCAPMLPWPANPALLP